jgi:hypothetical protein
MRPDSKRPWVALPHKRQIGKSIFVVVGLRHQGETGEGVCAFVVVPFHVSNDVGLTILVQEVFEEVLDLTVDCPQDGTLTRACGNIEVQADVAVRVQIVSLRVMRLALNDAPDTCSAQSRRLLPAAARWYSSGVIEDPSKSDVYCLVTHCNVTPAWLEIDEHPR